MSTITNLRSKLARNPDDLSSKDITIYQLEMGTRPG